MLRLLILAAGLLASIVPAAAEQGTIKVIAAENFYGDIAKQLGGNAIEVKSVLSNPGQDPHLFEASPSLVKDVAEADVVIMNGADYDPWMEKLIAAAASPKSRVISVAVLAGKKPGDNPHIWYDLKTVRSLAKSMTTQFAELMPDQAEVFKRREVEFDENLEPIEAMTGEIAKAHSGVSVAATEPVFGYMLQAMGLDVQEKQFQLAVMNDVEPSVSDIAKFENDLNGKQIKLLIYNKQATDPVADKFKDLAIANGIPVVAVTETMPGGVAYQKWLLDEVDAVAKALGEGQ